MKENMPSLVLMPGLDGTGLLFDRLAAALTPGIRFQVVEYPNDVALSLGEHAALVAQSLPAGSIVLLAESFSGLVAMHLLREHRLPVKQVVFVASPMQTPRFRRFLSPLFGTLFGFHRFVPDALWRYFCMGPDATGSDISRLKTVLAQVDPAVVAHRLKLVASKATRKEGPIDIPAVYLQADADRLVHCRASEHFQEQFSRFTLVRVAGPHFLLQRAPVECARLVEAILVEGDIAIDRTSNRAR